MARRSTRAARIIGTVFLLLGVAGQVVAGVIALRTKSWVDSAVTATGKVVDHESRRSRKGRTYAERVQFQDGSGLDREFVSGLSTSSPYSIGETVPVRYDPNNPTSAVIDTHFRVWFVPGLVFVIGFGFTAVGFSIRLSRRS